MRCPRCHRHYKKPEGTGWGCLKCEEESEEQSRERFNDLIGQEVGA